MTARIERFTRKSDQVVLELDDPGTLCPRCIVNVLAEFPVSSAHESIKSARKSDREDGIIPSSLAPPPHSSTAELMASFVFVLVGDLALDVLALAPGLLASGLSNARHENEARPCSSFCNSLTVRLMVLRRVCAFALLSSLGVKGTNVLYSLLLVSTAEAETPRALDNRPICDKKAFAFKSFSPHPDISFNIWLSDLPDFETPSKS
jgi:hypothetical protein